MAKKKKTLTKLYSVSLRDSWSNYVLNHCAEESRCFSSLNLLYEDTCYVIATFVMIYCTQWRHLKTKKKRLNMKSII